MAGDSSAREARPAGSFGIDAAWVPWMWIGYAVLYVFLAVAAFAWWGTPWWLGALFVLVAVAWALGAVLYWYVTFRGKFVVWASLMNDVRLATGARALDLGCGRGAVAIQIARRFPAATVDGIDLWRSIDQTGNSVAALERNATLNGVSERITATTGDMTALPYGDDMFELVTASMSIHNIPTAEGRRAAVEEGWRVLHPGGTLLIVDIRRTGEYAATLRAKGATVTAPASVGWRMWWSGPWMSSKQLTAVKP